MNENSPTAGMLDRMKSPMSDAIEEEKKQHHQNYADIMNFALNRSPKLTTEAEENKSNIQSPNGAVVAIYEEEIAPVENYDEQIV